MNCSVYSGQSVVTFRGNTVIKRFYNPDDYYQEKYFLNLLTPINTGIIPMVHGYEDKNNPITMLNAGVTLDSLPWQTDRYLWAQRISQAMAPVWSSNLKIVDKYTKNRVISFEDIEQFLSIGYETELKNAGIEDSLIKESINWLIGALEQVKKETTDQSALLHFDLSPRNVLIKENKITVIDWSRSVLSQPVIELGIMREKFGLVGYANDYLLDTAMAQINPVSADRIALCFQVYRQAKQVGRGTTTDSYRDALRAILNTRF